MWRDTVVAERPRVERRFGGRAKVRGGEEAEYQVVRGKERTCLPKCLGVMLYVADL